MRCPLAGVAEVDGPVFFPISEWLPAFGLTLVIEWPIVVLLVRRLEPDLVRLSVLVVTVNLATHLAAWYVLTQLLSIASPVYVLVAESWAMAAEAVFYVAAIRGLTAGRAVGVALTANLTSFVVGRGVFTALWSWLMA